MTANVGCGAILAFDAGPGYDGSSSFGGVQPERVTIWRSRDHGNTWALRSDWNPAEWWPEYDCMMWSTGRMGEALLGTYGPDRGGPPEVGLGLALTRDEGFSYGPVILRSLFCDALPSSSGTPDGKIDYIRIKHGSRMAGSDTHLAAGYYIDNDEGFANIILRSTDGGRSIRETIRRSPEIDSTAWVVAVPPETWMIFPWGANAGIRSTDDGRTWQNITIPGAYTENLPPGESYTFKIGCENDSSMARFVGDFQTKVAESIPYRDTRK